MALIRKLQDQDWQKFKKIFLNLNQTEFPEFSPKIKKYHASSNYARDRMFRAGLVLGAFDKKNLVGILVAATPFGGVMSIEWLSIVKKYQKRGIGKKLLLKIEKFAAKKGIHNIQTKTFERNIGFYRRCGYEVFGNDHKSYYGLNLYLVKKILQEPDEEKFLPSNK